VLLEVFEFAEVAMTQDTRVLALLLCGAVRDACVEGMQS